jgi:hypothetical protein
MLDVLYTMKLNASNSDHWKVYNTNFVQENADAEMIVSCGGVADVENMDQHMALVAGGRLRIFYLSLGIQYG